jgi:hypothetical protein
LRAEALGGSGDLAAARGEGVEQTARHSGYLEVATMFAGAPLDRITPLLKLVRERRAVVGTDLPRGAEDRPGSDRDDLPVLADRTRYDDVAVQLRVRRVPFKDTPRSGVAVLGGHYLLRVLLDLLPAIAVAHRRHRFGEMSHRFAHCRGVRSLHLAALRRVSERPHGRDRLRGAESQVDPAATAAGGAGPAKPRSASGVASFHQRDEVWALNRAALDPESGERVRGGKPLAGGLGELPVGAQVVVAALWLHGL